MWRVIKSEFAYHHKLFGGFLIIIPFFWLVVRSLAVADLPLGMLLFVMLFLLLQNWTTIRNKDRRERLQALLPLPAFQTALARMAVVVFAALVYGAIHYFFVNLIFSGKPFDMPFMLKVCAIVIIGFSLYFVLRDFFAGFFRKFGIAKNSIVIGAVLVLLGLNFLGIFALHLVKTTGKSPVDLRPFLLFIVKSDPFAGEYGILKFFVWITIFSAVTVLTFRRRKSYLD